jgi:hypothetical protein
MSDRQRWRSGQHPDNDTILLSIEGELAEPIHSAVQRHLRECRQCRSLGDRLQRGMLAFTKFRQEHFIDGLQPPPRDWSGFVLRLHQFVAEKSPSPRDKRDSKRTRSPDNEPGARHRYGCAADRCGPLAYAIPRPQGLLRHIGVPRLSWADPIVRLKPGYREPCGRLMEDVSLTFENNFPEDGEDLSRFHVRGRGCRYLT